MRYTTENKKPAQMRRFFVFLMAAAAFKKTVRLRPGSATAR